MAAPSFADAQTRIDREADRRQQTKNEWRNIAYVAGAAAVLGALQRDNTLTFAGAAGALYALHRYEQDRKSQSSLDRARAQYFSRDHFYRDGVRYDRRTVRQNGQTYYQFVRNDDYKNHGQRVSSVARQNHGQQVSGAAKNKNKNKNKGKGR
jgi:hypothetical protein